MGVFSTFDRSKSLDMHQRLEHVRVSAMPVALEPAYVTLFASRKLCTPPGLAIDASTCPFPADCPKVLEDFGQQLQQQLPSKLIYDAHSIDTESIVGSVLKVAAAYDPQPAGNRNYGQPITWPRSFHQGFYDAGDKRKENKRRAEKKRCCNLLIATQLSKLQDEDPRKLLIVRKINRLGFNSASILQEHFGRYGNVSKVLLSNSHEKGESTLWPTRLRPSGIGFVLFESVEGAALALAEGAEQIVRGNEIVVRAFEKRRPSEGVSGASDGNESTASNTPKSDEVAEQVYSF